MPRRKIGKEHIRNVQRSRGSYHISIPINAMRLLGWKERQKVVVRVSGKGLTVKDWPAKGSTGPLPKK